MFGSAARCFLLPALLMAPLADRPADYREGSLAKQEPQPIYAADPRDSWNRIFYLWFTRTVEVRLTEDFKVDAPFSPISTMGNDSLPVTTRVFQRIESGDRAIDPLYPNFLSAKGAEAVLVEPQFTELKQALQEACTETTSRPALDRALMQGDAWAAYEILSWLRLDRGQKGQRARELLPLLSRFISKLALSSQEIDALSPNYQSAQSRLRLPEVFVENSTWVELEWFPYRSHDAEVGNRRAARVFVKPVNQPQQFFAEVNQRINKNDLPLPDPTRSLNGAALVTEALLIDRAGRVVPSPITYDVQVRAFARNVHGEFQSTTVAQYELSRKLLLSDPSSGGLVRVAEDDLAYLPASGNDFTFASPTLEVGESKAGPPVLGTLRRRCQSCHGPDPGAVFTFQMKLGRNAAPKVRRLRTTADEHARFVARQKMKKADFKLLQTRLQGR